MYEWLRRVGLQPTPATEYQQLFVREEFNELALRVATLDQLKELGVTKLGHRTLIHNALPGESMITLADQQRAKLFVYMWY